jgi:glycine dehydrogenase subunit 1
MDYIQNTEADVTAMLKVAGLAHVDDLFDAIPAPLRYGGPLGAGAPRPEPELLAHLGALADRNTRADAVPCFLGGGYYRRFVPAVVEQLASRAEFVTAYTPYQAESSQGLLQAFFEFQTMVSSLYGMDAANASHYDGATALAEALLMACTITDRSEVVLSAALNPEYRRVAATYLRESGVAVRDLPAPGGATEPAAAAAAVTDATACLAIQVPNFFGVVEPGRALAEAAHARGALVVASADPVSLGLLQAPGRWGADIAVGEGQSLGLDLSYGGPGVGLLSTRKEYVKRLPGRIVGATVDCEGRRAFVLTLQTREQHIRREKASSNICSNQALMALRATIYLAALGPQGLRRTAALGARRALSLHDRVTALPGYRPAFDAPFLGEFAVRCPRDPEEINRALRERGILGGLPLKGIAPGLDDAWLLCATEVTTGEEIDRLATALAEIG